MNTLEKLEILADAAKYDASCASSGARKRDSRGGKGVGSAGGVGICHSYAPDGRCISLLKVLLTNVCLYDCHYCINRRSSNVRRARFTPEEVVELTLSFYKRNYIEGLFLSSGIVRSADYTMEQVLRVARLLREEHDFRGYIHLKTIPEASPELIAEAGRYADRLSINVELPRQETLKELAPEKNVARTRNAMGTIRGRIDEAKSIRREKSRSRKKYGVFATGQSTQMIVGMDGSTDAHFLHRAGDLYGNFKLRRVYYSAFSPIPEPSVVLPLKSPPLVREHRLYQADWLLRFYGFEVGELTTAKEPNLDLDLDPKLSWALRNRATFPVDVNRASLEMLYRIPGLGVRNAQRIVRVRRHHALRLQDLIKMRVNVKKCMPFMICADHQPARLEWSSERLRAHFAPPPEQMELSFEGVIQTKAPKVPEVKVKQAQHEAGAEALSGEF
ncbi:putative DNA modification/repair radical SAM protein [Rubritalea squalenifaciens DSM 18772]|uniref:Putative DNA modification/repair radical SAM protein n=1 Tax=Rubritalea squalenifaciens DSM 18772 TaxID=1123071 RepID=A0A1M6KNU3_9BACT|nr:putative DNA modification/repair radical SAM protein [Rubritalea squalenifaciens]SHJ60683.1 putative DNA modification/repair radical SAM protein [Rubritalea squalenifaciens DSM 18772]